MDLAVILNLALIVVIVGGVLYLLGLAPLDPTVKRIGQVLILLVAIVWAIRWLLGLLHS